MRSLELLAPAGNAEIAKEAILHGADAVYIGATSHGARQNASNSIDDIKRVVDFAHIFRAKVYVTVNTIIYERELSDVERLISDIYTAGADAIIVQDMGILRMDIPPIELHASTQCDIRTPEKARFLQDAGFSQLVLPRELTLEEIRKIAESVDIPIEVFVHGALCVSYSGRCHASMASCGRSANRGQCAQICRLPFTLKDATGRIIAKDKHLLSLRDLNTIDLLPQLVDAGVSSFKIEGRLKEAPYVKNTVSAYREAFDKIISSNPDKYKRSSCGISDISFTPSLSKSFNRGFSHYFLQERRPSSIASILTPKSLGETIEDTRMLNNGDGISFFDSNGKYTGDVVNGIEGHRIITSRNTPIPSGAVIHRTFDRIWDKQLKRPTATRKIRVRFSIDRAGVSVSDERGNFVRIPLDIDLEAAKKEPDYSLFFAKLGNTHYVMESFDCKLPEMSFIPAGEITDLRRRLIAMLDEANITTYPYSYRRREDPTAAYMTRTLDFRDNVSNSLARKFYRDHGVEKIEPAMESSGKKIAKDTRVMTTRHCILRELGMCKKTRRPGRFTEPLILSSGKESYRLEFNCRDCEMHLLK